MQFIPLLVFLYPFSKSLKERNHIALVVTGLYLISSISSLFMDESLLPWHNFNTDSPFVFLLYSFLLLPFLLLTMKIKPIYDFEVLPSGSIFNVLIIVMFMGALFSLIYIFPYALVSISMDAVEVRTSGTLLPSSYLTTIAVGFPTFYYLYVFLFYTCLVQKRSKIVTFGMLLGLLAFVVNVLTVSGRDGVFLAGIAFLIGFLLFKPLLTEKQIGIIKKIFIVSVILALLLILRITTERFGSGDQFNLQVFKKGILSYLGMQPYIFSDWIKYNDVFYYGNRGFALFVDILGLQSEISSNDEHYTWNFGTFLANFYAVSGFASLIVLSLFFWSYFKLQLNKINKLNIIATFFLLGFYFHFIISGMFYFRMGTSGGNLFMILSIVGVFLFRKKLIIASK